MSDYVFFDLDTGQPVAVQPRPLSRPRRRNRASPDELAVAAELGAAFLRGDLQAPGVNRSAIEQAIDTLIAALDAADSDCDLEDGGDDELSCSGSESNYSNWRLTHRTLRDGCTLDMSRLPADVRTVDPHWQTMRIVNERDRLRFPSLPPLPVNASR